MLNECKEELTNVIASLKLYSVGLTEIIGTMQLDMENMHQQILELTNGLSDSDGDSLKRSVSFRSQSSDSLLSILPSNPKIFHGRENELEHVVILFTSDDTPRIAILGPGGIGKTSLARAVLHHPTVVSRYPGSGQCFFVACDVALSAQDFLVLIGSQLGLQVGRTLRREIVAKLDNGQQHLLVLDNMETLWDPVEWRNEVDDVLGFLGSIPNLALLITMRGAERPATVQWTRPFLPPLEPLTEIAARQTFFDIADESSVSESGVQDILQLTDNVPLAITLMAHLVDSEGVATVLSRWDGEKTALLSDGFDKRSNLDISISLSLSSPRFQSNSHAMDLLSLLCILPDGLAESDIQQLPIQNPLGCKTALLRTSLAYVSANAKRINLLVPIREYVRRHHPPAEHLIQPIFENYLHTLAASKDYYGVIPSGNLIARINANFANIQTLMAFKLLDSDTSNFEDLVRCAVYANIFSRTVGKGEIPFLAQLDTHGRFEMLSISPTLEVQFLSERISAYYYKLVPGPALIERALALFPRLEDALTKCTLYSCASDFYRNKSEFALAKTYTEKTLALSRAIHNTRLQCSAFCSMCIIDLRSGNPLRAFGHARQAEAQGRLGGDLWSEAAGLRGGALCLSRLGAYAESIEWTTRARRLLALCDIAGNQLDMSLLMGLGEVHAKKTEYLAAKAVYEEILRYRPVDRLNGMHVVLLVNLAEISVALDLPVEETQRHIDLARTIAGNIKWWPGRLMCDLAQGELLLSQQEYSRAKVVMEKVVVDAVKELDIHSVCCEKLADRDLWDSDSWDPKWPTVLLAQAGREKQHRLWCKALQCFGTGALAEGDVMTARSLFVVALEGFTQMDIHCSRAECFWKLGIIAEGVGDRAGAVENWDAARLLFERASQAARVTIVQKKLADYTTSR
ncbi:ATPase-AAA-core domain-containing protein [Mycena indigotica]|uniref:ATPase-AAA-core domain-containing protein n=1 Tax=Mycena indigotica TaxID=2126181 RepID=A0A8H6T630_9AGAR|nr:ATPase-AAA-core domain-containing protein [Mycena indigotica]KAF7310090.1 ATPase-AAA-core domain-containing protein [Mycena indigotica]